MKANLGSKLEVTFQLINTHKGTIGVLEFGTGEGWRNRAVISGPEQLLDTLFEMNEAMKQHGKLITHYPQRHDELFKQHGLKDF